MPFKLLQKTFIRRFAPCVSRREDQNLLGVAGKEGGRLLSNLLIILYNLGQHLEHFQLLMKKLKSKSVFPT